MSFLIIMQLNNDRCPFEKIKIENSLSRADHNKSRVLFFRDASFLSAYLVFEHLDNIRWFDSEEFFGLIFGEPILEKKQQISEDIMLWQIAKGDVSVLEHSRGSFCGYVYLKGKKQVICFTDKMGIFPIYFFKSSKELYVSTSLRVLQNLLKSEITASIPNLLTLMSFGSTLGRETPFKEIMRLNPGEYLRLGESGVDLKSYWDWMKIESNELGKEEVSEIVYNTFLEAVRLRLNSVSQEVSFLSGGLDSRIIVACLANYGKEVFTINFAPQGCKDNAFAKMAAKRLNTNHFETLTETGSFDKQRYFVLKKWIDETHHRFLKDFNPYCVWTGDGGSVGLGHVYMDSTLVELLRQNRAKDASKYFIEKEKRYPAYRIFKKALIEGFNNSPGKKMTTELESYAPTDSGKKAWIYFMFNDQRNHLNEYFENYDLYPLTMKLPFYDSKLLEIIMGSPIDYFLGHDLYHDILDKFGVNCTEVPWQTYPEHLPCPVPNSESKSLRCQWKDGWSDAEAEKILRMDKIKVWRKLISHRINNNKFLSMPIIILFYLMTKLNFRDYGYALDSAVKIDQYQDYL